MNHPVLSTDELVTEKELNGLYITATARILLLIIAVVAHIFTYKSLPELVTVCASATVICILTMILLMRAYRTSNPSGAAITGAIIDVIILAYLPVIWYTALGGNAIPSAFLTKTMFSFICLMLLIINMLSLKPVYPLIIGAASGLIQSSILLYTHMDVRSKFSSSLLDIINADTVVQNFQIAAILGSFLAAGVGSYITYVFRSLAFEAAAAARTKEQMTGSFLNGSQGADRQSYPLEQTSRRQPAAILFVEIRDFTSITELLPPERLLNLLSIYHDEMVSIISELGGTVEKFMSDGILAVFGTPDARTDDVERAVRAGIRMQKNLPIMNSRLRSHRLPPVAIGIGLHFGQVISGMVSGRGGFEFTVLGDTVNTASRVESACKTTEKPLLFTGAVKDRLPASFIVRPVGFCKLRGKDDRIELYTAADEPPVR